MNATFLKAGRLVGFFFFSALGALAFTNAPAIAGTLERAITLEAPAHVAPPTMGEFAITITHKRYDAARREYANVEVVNTQALALEGKTFIAKSYDTVPYICEITNGKVTKNCSVDIGLDMNILFEKLDTKTGQAVTKVTFGASDLQGYRPLKLKSVVGNLWIPMTTGQNNVNSVVIAQGKPAELKLGDYDVQIALVSMK